MTNDVIKDMNIYRKQASKKHREMRNLQNIKIQRKTTIHKGLKDVQTRNR